MTLPTLLDPDDLLTMPDGDLYELIDGVPKEKEMGARSSAIAIDLSTMLVNFVKLHRLGRVFGADAGYACFPARPKTYRKPDASFVAQGRLPDGKIPEGNLTIAPDLAVEVISPRNSYEEVEEKIALYRSAGVKLIWVIRPLTGTAMIHRLDGSADEVAANGSLSGEDVIPGFVCKIAELFE